MNNSNSSKLILSERCTADLEEKSGEVSSLIDKIVHNMQQLWDDIIDGGEGTIIEIRCVQSILVEKISLDDCSYYVGNETVWKVHVEEVEGIGKEVSHKYLKVEWEGEEVESGSFYAFGLFESFLQGNITVVHCCIDGAQNRYCPEMTNFFMDMTVKRSTDYLQELLQHNHGQSNQSKSLLLALANVLPVDGRSSLKQLQEGDSVYQIFLTIICEDFAALGEFDLLGQKIKNYASLLEMPMAEHLARKYIQESSQKQAELEKQAHMFELLSPVINRLGTALIDNQHLFGQVQAIMHDPAHSIFAVQPGIARLFVDNSSISNPDNSKVDISHQPDQYKSRGNPQDAWWVLAHAMACFRGEILVEGNGKEEKNASYYLLDEAQKLIDSVDQKSSPYHELAGVIIRLLTDEPSNVYFEKLRNEISENSNETVVKSLTRLKDYLHRPFKAGRDSEKALSFKLLQIVLSGEVETYSVRCNTETITPDDDMARLLPAILPKCNPFATQGHLLSFLTSIVGQHKSYNCESVAKLTVSLCLDNVLYDEMDDLLKVTSAGAAKVTFKSENHNWLPLHENKRRELKSILDTEMKMFSRQWDARGEYGDFYRPFVQLIRKSRSNMPPEFVHNVDSAHSAYDLKITFGHFHLEIIFRGSEFSIISRR